MAVDYGLKRIGLAVCDALEITVRPLAVVANQGKRRQVLDQIGRIVADEGVEEIVVGVPLNFDGSRGPAALGAEEFARALAERVGLPVRTHDEYRTTVEADERLRAVEKDRQRRKARIDMAAAALILEEYLGSRRRPAS